MHIAMSMASGNQKYRLRRLVLAKLLNIYKADLIELGPPFAMLMLNSGNDFGDCLLPVVTVAVIIRYNQQAQPFVCAV